MNREERVLKYINSSDDFLVDGKRYCENDFYNDVEDLAKENKILRENAEHNDRVVDRVNWENLKLKNNLKKRVIVLKVKSSTDLKELENMILSKIFIIDELYSLVDSMKEVMSCDDRRDV